MVYTATGIVLHPVAGTPVTSQPRVRVYSLADFTEFSPGTPIYAAASGVVTVTGLTDTVQYAGFAFLSRHKPQYVPLVISAASLVAGGAFATPVAVVSSATGQTEGVATTFARSDHRHGITAASIVDADVNASAAIAASKVASGAFGGSAVTTFPSQFKAAGTMLWRGTAIGSSAQTLVADGAGDATYGAVCIHSVLKHSTEGLAYSGGSNFVELSSEAVVASAGSFYLRVNANGSIDVRYTGGSGTYDATLLILWY